jgi:uncharacterized damage-inducible protein DinB
MFSMKIENVALSPVPNFSRDIGFFLSGLEKVRKQWREAVMDLSKEELARKVFPEVQPIGTLILHIAEGEYFWIQTVVQGVEMTEEVKNLLHYDMWFDDFASKDLDSRYCINAVETIHEMTREALARFNDDDLEKTFIRRREDRESHCSLRWILLHLTEHEATHKGQIMMLKRLVRAA